MARTFCWMLLLQVRFFECPVMDERSDRLTLSGMGINWGVSATGKAPSVLIW